jgi:alpha-amylase
VAPFDAVTFVENRDTDSGLDPVLYNKALGYAYILTSEGYPCVYYKDYSTDAGCYGLKPVIDNLMWIHQKFASGPTQQRWKDFNLFVYERLGEPGLLVALNNDLNNGRTVTVQTAFGPNRQLHDYTGHSGDVTTDGSGQATITIPNKTDNTGQVTGYVCYAPAGESSDLPVAGLTTTQQFEAAADLDIVPATTDKPTLAGRVWAVAKEKITVECAPLPDGASLRVAVRREDDEQTKAAVFPGPAHSVSVQKTGWHRVEVVAESLPEGATNLPYTLTVTYQAPQTF